MRTAQALAPWLMVGGLLLAWEAACRLLGLSPIVLPPPSAVLAAVAAGRTGLVLAGAITLGMALAALFVATAVALPLALAAALSPATARAIQPLAVTLQVTPVIAIAPLVVIWAGLDHPERAIIALAAVVAFFPIFSGALTGLRSADPDLLRLFDLYGASPWRRLWALQAPAATPFVLEGLKVAVGLSLIGAIVAEFVAGSGAAQGLAWKILEAGQRLRTADMFAAVIVLGAMGAGLNALFGLAQRLLVARWRGR